MSLPDEGLLVGRQGVKNQRPLHKPARAEMLRESDHDIAASAEVGGTFFHRSGCLGKRIISVVGDNNKTLC